MNLNPSLLALTITHGWDPVFPPPVIALLWLLLAALAFRVTWWPGRQVPAGKRAFLLLLRLGALGLLVLPLLEPFREESWTQTRAAPGILVALDSSASMAETDTPDGASRLDQARALIRENQLKANGLLGTPKLFEFAAESRLLPPGGIERLSATGETTRFGDAINGILREGRNSEKYSGLILLTDGHDFQGQSPELIGKNAARRRIPIFPVPVGRALELPDVAVSMISAQPMTFVRQKARLEAELRFRSVGSRRFRVELLRDGKPLRRQEITSQGDGSAPVTFEVMEEEPGQYEYEIRCPGLTEERILENNSVHTYLNVADARIPVLLVEGEPHWDTGFLQRSLSRNARVSFDSITAMGASRRHTFRSDPAQPPLPEMSPALIAAYPVVILGRNAEAILNPECVRALVRGVNEDGVTLIFARGNPGSSPEWAGISPAAAASGFTGPVNFLPGGSRGDVVPLELLETYGMDKLPALPAAAAVGAPKTLASVEARVSSSPGGSGSGSPAMLLRRQGAGQVFEVTVDGLWKWSLNASAPEGNNIFDRFWNQLLLNLISRASRSASDKPQLVISRANVAVGEEARFQLLLPVKEGQAPVEFPQPPQLRILREEAEISSLTMQREGARSNWGASLVAAQPGKFHAELKLPGGEILRCKYGVYAAEAETTSVSTDLPFLRKLAEASGGRVLNPSELADFVDSLARSNAAESAAPPIVRRHSLWNNTPFFWTLCLLFGADWLLRRRWGFV